MNKDIEEQIKTQYRNGDFHKEYAIYIKSHCESPDYEDTCEATSLTEAAIIFAKHLNKNDHGDIWDENDIIKYINEIT